MAVRTTALSSLALALFVASAAHAQGTYDGQWREGPLSVSVQVESWGGDCGPRPVSTTSPGGGTFRISQSGDQLTFHMRSERTTRSCWSENRAVRRVSSSHQAGTWRVVCRTPSADSRAETGTYTIQAIGEDRLSFRDVSQYDWQLNTSRCQGTITTTQSFSRVGGGTATPTPTTPEPERERCTPGEARRVVLRPSTADVPPGGEQCFSARVVDAAGCAVRQRVTLTVAEGEGSIEGTCYVATSAEGTARIVASAGSFSDEARVSVRPMDLSDLIARRTETGSVGSGSPEEADPTSQTRARVSARTEEAPDLVLPAVALVGALLLVAIAVILLRRRRPAPTRSIPRSVRPPPPTDDESIDDEPVTDAPAPVEGPGEDRICPTCRRGYPPRTARCPHDDTELVLYREFVAGGGHTKVCPACGKTYPPTVTFCGEDGTTLESREPE